MVSEVCFSQLSRRYLRAERLRNSRVPSRENGLDLKQERPQLDVR